MRTKVCMEALKTLRNCENNIEDCFEEVRAVDEELSEQLWEQRGKKYLWTDTEDLISYIEDIGVDESEKVEKIYKEFKSLYKRL